MKIIYISLITFLVSISISSAKSISVNESLAISIKGVPSVEQNRIDGSYVVDSQGNIRMPLIDPIRARGLNSSALAREIEKAYQKNKIYSDPRINIISPERQKQIANEEQKIVSIGGYVKAPGARPYRKNMTLFQAISAAGGPTTFGSIRRVELIRKGVKTIYDLRKLKAKEVRVRSGDTINVPVKNAIGG